MAKQDITKLAVDCLSAKQAKAEHARLHAELTAHDKRYFQDDAPTVSDAEYDALRKRYGEIEQRFPDLRTLESLTLKVGAAPTGRFAKVRHAVPMLSLDNAFSEEDVTRFVERIRRFLKLDAEEPLAFSAEPKIDGLSLSLRYEGGKLVNARDARRRRGGRGRHRERPHAEGRAADAQGQGHSGDRGGARRGLHDQGRLPRAQRAPEGGGRRALCQPAQHRGRLAAAEGRRPSRRRGRCASSPMRGAR